MSDYPKEAFIAFRNMVWEVAEGCRKKAVIGVSCEELPDVLVHYLALQKKHNNIEYVQVDAYIPGTSIPAKMLTVFKDFDQDV